MADEEAGQSKRYAVVEFDDSDFSVVPTIWLEEPNYCYWPEGIRNIRTLIIREIPIKSSWNKYECHILNTYESALKAEKEAVASSQSETESKRKRKRTKFTDYVDVPEPPRMNRLCESDTAGSSQENENTTVNSSQENENTTVKVVHDDNRNVTITEHNMDNIPVLFEDNIALITLINDLKMILSGIEAKVTNIKEKQEQSLSQIQETTNLILAKINSEQYSKESIVQDTKIGQYLPLSSIDNFLTFEDMLKTDQEAFMQVVNKVMLIEGKHEKDFIRRSLSVTFSDDLASMCSWTGQKNNYKIGDTHTILIIKKAFRAIFPRSTEKDFEHFVMEWFRFANVRKERKKH
ncbi:uncharacterized protein [Temnothorax longispinosus]|uniref:uncharacterized protein isoform X3 n=1 Tax=Temnothorax longispinosus TaxID=300112 RepID=UPI003A99106E